MGTALTVLKAPTGGYVGDGHVHPAVLDAAREAMATARSEGVVSDSYVARCGDDIALVVLHRPEEPDIGPLGESVFARCWTVARDLGQHGCTNGGPVPERVGIQLDAEPETIVVLLADKAPAGAWNLACYRIFADPFNTPSLLTDPRMTDGFDFAAGETIFRLPDELHAFLPVVAAGQVVSAVSSRASGRVAAVVTEGADPALVLRCHDGFPSVGEALEPLCFPYAVAGTAGPLVPVSTNEDATTRIFGRAVGLGFQVAGGRLIGPRDLLGDRAFDEARAGALRAADYLKRHGPFTPAMSAMDKVQVV